MSNPLVTINLVVLNGEKYIRHCLDAVLAQTSLHEFIELNILDNNSTDGTKSIIVNCKLKIENSSFASFNFIESKQNLGMWPGQEELLKYSTGKYILAMAVDVILDKDFIKHAVKVMEKDAKIGAIQAKIYKYDLSQLHTTNYILPTTIIDTCGFKIEKSRRVTNIGHGLSSAEASASKGFNYDEQQEIFGVEGACPFFRREALEDCKISILDSGFKILESKIQNLKSEIFDHDYFWYGDDLDLAWRMTLFGWKQVFVPSVIAWHDRQTTKSVRKNWLDHVLRVPVRHQIPIKKRRLDWRNNRWTIIKNDYTINILKDLPYILWRELMVFGYTFLFEPRVFMELSNFIKLISKMLRKRKEIMKRAILTPEEIRKYFP